MLLPALKIIVLGVGGIALTKDQFQELQTIGQNISKRFRHEIITQDTNGNNEESRNSDNELTEQI